MSEENSENKVIETGRVNINNIDEIESIIQVGDNAIFDQNSIRHYLEAIAKTQVLILKEMRE